MLFRERQSSAVGTTAGQSVDPDDLATVLGIPAWLCWGIFAPWLVADLFTVWFCFCYMQDDDLGEARDVGEPEGRLAQQPPEGEA